MFVIDIVGVVVIGAWREAVAEIVDVRLTVIDRVLVGHAVDVLDVAIVSVGDLVINVVRVLNIESVPVEVALELTELVVEAVCVLDCAIDLVVLTLTETVLELIELDDAVGVYTGVTVLLLVVVILVDPEIVLDCRILTDPDGDPE